MLCFESEAQARAYFNPAPRNFQSEYYLYEHFYRRSEANLSRKQRELAEIQEALAKLQRNDQLAEELKKLQSLVTSKSYVSKEQAHLRRECTSLESQVTASKQQMEQLQQAISLEKSKWLFRLQEWLNQRSR